MLDINVLLDVFQQRHPHYTASAQVVALAVKGTITGFFPAHGLTTLYYLVRRHNTVSDAEEAVDRIIKHLTILSPSQAGWVEARKSGISDFEDAVVAQSAADENLDFIITRNVADFAVAHISAITPADFLGLTPP